MEYRENTNNNVEICGTVRGGLEFSHESYGEKFYETTLEVERASGWIDEVPVMVSERLADTKADWDGAAVFVAGEMRSYNKWDGSRNRLFLHVFGKYFAKCEETSYVENSISLDGYICKPVNYRETPTGREIADIMLAVNRAYGKSDYIPCICWGRNARFSSGLEIGNHIRINGRIQSRKYSKFVSEGKYVQRTAYEVSASSLEVISDDESQKN